MLFSEASTHSMFFGVVAVMRVPSIDIDHVSWRTVRRRRPIAGIGRHLRSIAIRCADRGTEFRRS
jgi:hypothetical protein